MAVHVIDTIKPKNNLNFPVVEAIDVYVEGYDNLADAVSHFATDVMIEAINVVLSDKANTSDVNTAVANLQGQINQIVISASAESVVAPEVAAARVGANGTEFDTLKDRLDYQEKASIDAINTINEGFADVSRAFGFAKPMYVEYLSNEVPKTDGTFFKDTSSTQSWYGSGFIGIPDGVKSIRYCGEAYKSENINITPIALYAADYTLIDYAPVNSFAPYEGVISVPNNAKYFYQTKYFVEGDSRNSSNFTKFFFGEEYDIDYISQAAIATGITAQNYTSADYTSDVIYMSDGSTKTISGWNSTGFINCYGRDTVSYNAYSYKNSSTDVAYVAFFDSGYQMIGCLKSSDTTNGEHSGTTTIPTGAKFVRAVTAGSITPKLQLNETGIYARYNLDDIALIKAEVGDDVITYTSDSFTSTDIYMADGTTRTFAEWYSTDFIDCSGHESIMYDSYAYHSPRIDVAYVAFFDDSRQMISCLKSSDTINGEQTGTVNVPEGAKYVRSVSAGEITPVLQLSATGMMKDIYDLQNAEKFPNTLTHNAKICCIGDSLTQGIDYGSHQISENYPYFMSKYLGCTIINYGRSGSTPKTWWSHVEDYPFDSTIDTVLIMFGTNGGLTTNTLDTDVEPYDDPDDYADTSVGCYCKIIEKIMADTQNHAQIIILTAPYSTYTEAQEQVVINSEPTIRAIAKRYQLPVIDVLNECGMGKFNGAVFRPHDGCHFNAKGYHRLGTFLGSKVMSMISRFDLTDVYNDEYTDE